MTITPEESYDQRYNAQFEGLPFEIITGGSRSGSNGTVEDAVLGLGSRSRFTVSGVDSWRIDGYLRHDQIAAYAERFNAALHLYKNARRQGLLIHPWYGPLQVIPVSWTIDEMPDALDAMQFSGTFDAAELPPQDEQPSLVAQTADALVSLLSTAGRGFAGEPTASAQLDALQIPLGLPPTLLGADYTAAATARLATSADLPTDRIPAAVQSLGASARLAESGELTTGARDSIFVQVQREAERSNSLVLLNLRTEWSLYLGSLGVDAYPQPVEAARGLLQALPGVAAGNLDRLARLNRAAVQGWRVAKEART